MLGHPLAATIGDSARCMQNLEKVLFTGPKRKRFFVKGCVHITNSKQRKHH